MALDLPTLDHSVSFSIGGVPSLLRSNSVAALDTVRRWRSTKSELPALTISVRVEDIPPRITPTQFRGMDHLVVARYGENLFLFDLLQPSVHARLSEAVATDSLFWSQRILPLILGLMGCSLDVLPLHSGCIVMDGRGILLAGASMAGKSTLTVALAQRGFEFLSDDWTYIRNEFGELEAHGLDAPVKLLADASLHFSDLQDRRPGATANGEIGFELSPSADLGFACARRCIPGALLFVERVPRGATHLVRVSRSYVLRHINHSVERLPAALTHLRAQRKALIQAVSELPAWRFRYAGSPQRGATHLAQFVEKTQEVTR